MPVTEIERPNFYEGQYLNAADLVAEQEYERQQDQRHRLAAHTWGIAAGLELEERALGGGAMDVYIKPGYAVDGFGRAIVVLEPYKIPAEFFAQFPPGITQLVPIYLQYLEQKTTPPRSGFFACGTGEEWSRIQETYQLVVGRQAKTRDQIFVGGKMLDAFAEAPDGSIPYQTFPEKGEDLLPYPDPPSNLWLIGLGYVTWSGTQLVRSTDPATLVQDRSYAGVIAAGVLAPAGRLRIANRFPGFTLAPPIAVTLEGSLEVDRLLTAKQDAYIQDDAYINGRVGIGITAPLPRARLTINGLVQPQQGSLTIFSQDADFAYDGGDDNLFIFNDTGGKTAFIGGKVGFGTSDPQSNLHLNVPASDTPISALSLDVASFGNLTNAANSHYLQVRDTGALSTAFLIRGDGNIGIGTDAPESELHLKVASSPNPISGMSLDVESFQSPENASKSHFLRIRDLGAGPSNVLFVRGDGNIGIGTANPTEKLEVAGNLNVTGLINGHDLDAELQNLAGGGRDIEVVTGEVLDGELISPGYATGKLYEYWFVSLKTIALPPMPQPGLWYVIECSYAPPSGPIPPGFQKHGEVRVRCQVVTIHNQVIDTSHGTASYLIIGYDK